MKLEIFFCLIIRTVFAVRGTIISKKNNQLTIERYNSEEDLNELEEQLFENIQINDRNGIFEQGETRDFLRFLEKIKYDHRQSPNPETQGPVAINVSIVVSNIKAVSEGTMDYNVEVFYRECWTDRRLTFSEKIFNNKSELSLHESYSNFLWHPDTFIPNSIASKNPRQTSISHRSLLRLRNDGRVLYSRRLSLFVTCGMDLTLFPFDSQLCKLGVESYGYTAEQVRYEWSREAIAALTLYAIRIPDFKIKEAFVTSQIKNYETGNYSRLYVCFVFSRAAGFCFLQLIIPSTAVVITSWVSLSMESKSSFQDMISIILTITFLLFSYNEVMPRVSYIKAMDVYLGVCFCIVFFSLIKLAVVKYMRKRSTLLKDTSINIFNVPIVSNNENVILTRLSSRTSTRCADFEMKGNSGDLQLVKVLTKNDEKRHQYSNSNFTPRFMRSFHWISQITFFFTFTVFCLFYFLIYPNIHTQLVDDDCERASSEWFAELS